MRQLAPSFGISKSAADRIIDHLGPLLALQPRKRFAKDTVLIVDRRAADEALLGFTEADLREQAEAIRSGARYMLRVRVTPGGRAAGRRGVVGPSGRRAKGVRTGSALHPPAAGAPGDMPDIPALAGQPQDPYATGPAPLS